jgi:excisionase family DNA binding protein
VSYRAAVPDLASAAITPRLIDRSEAARYLGVSCDTLDRLIQTGQISVVRLPVERHRKTGRGVPGASRRILIDRVELDELCTRWRERAV